MGRIVVLLPIVILSFLACSDGKEIRKEYYPSGKLMAEWSYNNDKLNGISKSYYENGNVQTEETYKNGKLDGISKFYYTSGKLKADGIFKEGKKESLRLYNANGKLRAVMSYKDNKLNGRVFQARPHFENVWRKKECSQGGYYETIETGAVYMAYYNRFVSRGRCFYDGLYLRELKTLNWRKITHYNCLNK